MSLVTMHGTGIGALLGARAPVVRTRPDRQQLPETPVLQGEWLQATQTASSAPAAPPAFPPPLAVTAPPADPRVVAARALGAYRAAKPRSVPRIDLLA